jgi:deazaflavin-dependent oxidoreductase (nitroreductase family)
MATETDEGPVNAVEPPLPEAAYRVVNPLFEALLRSPLHSLVSNRLLLITFTGRKSGQEFTTPVAYDREGDTLALTSTTDSDWWRNLRGGQPVSVHLRGERRRAIAELTEDSEEVAQYLRQYIERNGVENTGIVGVRIEEGHTPTLDELRRAAREIVVVRVYLNDDWKNS